MSHVYNATNVTPGANMACGPLAPIASLDCSHGVGYQKLRCHKTVPDKLSDAKFDSNENLYSLNKHDASKLGMGSNASLIVVESSSLSMGSYTEHSTGFRVRGPFRYQVLKTQEPTKTRTRVPTTFRIRLLRSDLKLLIEHKMQG